MARFRAELSSSPRSQVLAISCQSIWPSFAGGGSKSDQVEHVAANVFEGTLRRDWGYTELAEFGDFSLEDLG